MGDECNWAVAWTFSDIAFLWDWNENSPFPFLWPLVSFPNLLTYWVQHFTASSSRIWNSSTGIPSPPLALFVVMLSKAHLTSHSRMSGSRWVITPSWLSRLWRSFLYSFSVYSCHLFLISSASVTSVRFLCFTVHLCMKCSLGISNFLEEISSLSHSIVFLYFFTLIAEEGFLISSCYSLELFIQLDISFLFFIFPFLLCWRVLTKNCPLEKGMANHFIILALRTPWTVWKDKKVWHWKMNGPGW